MNEYDVETDYTGARGIAAAEAIIKRRMYEKKAFIPPRALFGEGDPVKEELLKSLASLREAVNSSS